MPTSAIRGFYDPGVKFREWKGAACPFRGNVEYQSVKRLAGSSDYIMSRRDFFKIILISSLISSALTIMVLRWSTPPAAEARWSQPPEVKTFDTRLTEDEAINIKIYQALSRGVVNITSTTLKLNFWFEPIPQQGVGSGFLIDDKGHIVTNYHVVEKARRLDVTFSDKSKYKASVVGTDPVNDLAVVKIDCPAGKCIPLKLGDSRHLQVGQKVLAIGNPFGLQGTLTTGIISSLGRTMQTEQGIVEDIIQTDAAINPGNSGGPLLNTHGEVIGINTAILSRTGESAGIGFAIPVNTLSRIVSDLVQYGKVLRPWFGVRGIALTPDLADALNVPVEAGVLVEQVEKGSSADRAGIRGGNRVVLYGNFQVVIGGDILISLDGKPVTSSRQLNSLLDKERPGNKVSVVFYRGRQKLSRQVSLSGREGGRRFRF